MKKPGDVRTIHRFQSFQDRIQSINVDINRKIEKRYDTPEDEDTFFGEGLAKWRDLNQTEHFTNFYQEAYGHTQTFAQLIHYEKETVDLLLKHLRVTHSMAYDALLDLVVQLARDLQKDFYKYFEQFFDVIISVLNANMKSWEILEQGFTCLSYLFKFLWRQMVKDMKKVFEIYQPLMSETSADFIRRFAAESLSYLMRKVKDRKALFTVMFAHVRSQPDQAIGMGTIIFEMVKGPQKHLHSCAKEVLEYLLPTVGSKGTDSVEYELLEEALTLAAEHVDQANMAHVWQLVKAELDAVTSGWDKSKPKTRYKRLCSVSRIIHFLVSYKQGGLTPKPASDMCNDLVYPLLKELPQVEDTDSALVQHSLDTVRSIIMSDKMMLDTASVATCLSYVYSGACVLHRVKIFNLTRSMFDYNHFEKDVLRRLIDFCDECLNKNSTDDEDYTVNDVLGLLSQLVRHKRAEDRDGLYTPLNSYTLNHKGKGTRIESFVTQLLETCEADKVDRLWACATILPHLDNISQEKRKSLLAPVCKKISSMLLKHKSHDRHLSHLLAQVVQALLWSGGEPDWATILKLLQKYPSCPHTLRLTSLYLTNVSNGDRAKELLTEQLFTTVYPVLKPSISSYRSQIKLLSLRILSLFPLTLKSPYTDAGESRESVFTLCLDAETEHTTLNTYREKLRKLRRLDSDLIGAHLTKDGLLDDVPLRYLSSVLYVNFATIWPETRTLIEGFGKSMDRGKLWPCLNELLHAASQNCMEKPMKIASKTMDEESDEETTPEPFLSTAFTSSESHHTNDADDREDHINQRELLWKCLQAFPSVCEQNSKIIVQLFFQFLDKEYYISKLYDAPTEDVSRRQDGTEDENMQVDDEDMDKSQTTGDDKTDKQAAELSSRSEKKKARTKDIKATFLTKLKLFSLFNHPKNLSQEPRLSQLYHDLLLHRDPAIQKLALKCIMTYKKKHLTGYHENLERLLEEKTFRDELVLLTLDSEASTIKEVDRSVVMPVLLRILYGRMLHSTGKETKGKGSRGDLRRNIVLTFLAGCNQHELSMLLDLIAEPYKPILSDWDTVDLKQAVSGRRVQGLISTLTVVLDKLSHLMTTLLPRLYDMLMSVAKYCVHLLEHKKDEVNFYTLNSLKVARQGIIRWISQFMDKKTDYCYTAEELDKLFNYAVWPQLSRLSSSNEPTPLLKLIETWTKHRRYLALLMKRNVSAGDDNSPVYPLGVVMSLLPTCTGSVGTCIMSMVQNILEFTHPSAATDDHHMDTSPPATAAADIKPIDVGSAVDVVMSVSNYEVSMLFPHLGSIIAYIKTRVSKAALKGVGKVEFPTKELHVLSVCSYYVDDAELCTALMVQLIPFLTSGTRNLSENAQCNVMKTIGDLAKKCSKPEDQLCKLVGLCSSLTARIPRMAMVEMFMAMTDLSKACKDVAEFIRDVNAFDARRIEEPNYDSRLAAFRDVGYWDYELCSLALVAAIVHNCCFTIKHVDDMALRDSASNVLQIVVRKMPQKYYDFVVNGCLAPLLRLGIQAKNDVIRGEFLAIYREVVESRPDLYSDMTGLANPDNPDDDFWENIRHIQVSRRLKGLNRLMRHLEKVQMKQPTLSKYLLPLVYSFIKEETEYDKKNAMIDVSIATIGALCKQLIWSTYKAQIKIALTMLDKEVSSKMAVRLLCVILDSFHFDVSKSTYVEAQIGKELTTGDGETKKKTKTEEEKVDPSERPTEMPISHQPVQLAMDADIPLNENNEDEDEGIEMDSSHDAKSLDSLASSQPAIMVCPPSLATTIHSYVVGSLFPELNEMLSRKALSEDLHKDNKTLHPEQIEIIRIPLAIAMVRMLQKISASTLERHLPSVLVKVCHFIKSRAESIRDGARQTLARILSSLGMAHLATIVDQLKTLLIKGYQVPVLGYSVHYILQQNVSIIKPGDLTPCMHTLVNIIINGLFGPSSQAKDVDKKDTFKEKRKPQYYDMFALLAKFSLPSTLSMLVLPIKQKLDVIYKSADITKAKQSLERIAEGLLLNTSLHTEQYLKFTYSLITDSVSQFMLDKDEKRRLAREAKEKEKKQKALQPADTFIIPAEPGRRQGAAPEMKISNKHVLMEFGMRLLHLLLKKAKVSYNVEAHAQMMDPFIDPLIQTLSSEHVPTIIESLVCFTFIIKFRELPALHVGMEKLVENLFVLLSSYSVSGAIVGDSLEICQLCFKLVAMIVKTCNYYDWTEEKVEILLSYAEADMNNYSKQATAFSLLRAIISRKILCPLLRDVMQKARDLAVSSESPEIRLSCRQVVLQYMLDYPMGNALQKYITFFLDNLEFELDYGRESMLEMLGGMLTAFPQKTIHEYSGLIFVSLVGCRINDDTEKCRKLAALGIKTLLGRIEPHIRSQLFSMALTWLKEESSTMIKMAAQVMSIFVEVESDGISSRFEQILPVLEALLQPALYVTPTGESNASLDFQLYHVLLLFMKIIRECPRVLREEECNKSLEHVKKHILHPHSWVRFATAQVFGLVFSMYNPDELVALVLDKKSTAVPNKDMAFLLQDTRQRLRDFTADFCTQLSSQYMDEEFSSQIAKNLVFLAKVILKLPDATQLEISRPNSDAGSDNQNSPGKTKQDEDDEELSAPTNADGEATVTLEWLLKKLGKIAANESAYAPRQTVKRTAVLKCLAAIALDLGEERLSHYLPYIMPPIYREVTCVKKRAETEELRNLASEVSNLLKSTAGTGNFTSAYAARHSAVNNRRAERKRKLAQEAILDPSAAAEKKMKRHLKKAIRKRKAVKDKVRKGSKMKGKKKTAKGMAMVPLS